VQIAASGNSWLGQNETKQSTTDQISYDVAFAFELALAREEEKVTPCSLWLLQQKSIDLLFSIELSTIHPFLSLPLDLPLLHEIGWGRHGVLSM
jgi:hypothetical protein